MNKHRKEYLGIILAVLTVIMCAVFFLKPAWNIRSDGFGYYTYIRSALFDGDIYFKNEQEFFKEAFDVQKRTFYDDITTTGYYPNPFAIGQAMLWSPFIVAADAMQNTFNFEDPYSLEGYGPPFQITANVVNILFGLIGVIFSYKVTRFFTSKHAAILGTTTIVFATPLLYFFIYEGIWSHLTSFMVISMLYFYFFKYYEFPSVKNRMLLGAILGLACLVRWQNILFGSIFVIEMISWWKNKKTLKEIAIYQIALGMSWLAIFTPQMIAWGILYGSPFVKPPSNTHIYPLKPEVWKFLFSKSRGMTTWAPVYLFAFFGVFTKPFLNKKPKIVITTISWIAVLCVPIALQVYINSILSDWYGGGAPGSFGARRMLNASVVYILGLSAMLHIALQQKIQIRIVSYTILVVLCAVNILLIIMKARGYILFDLDLPLYKQFITGLQKLVV